MELLWGEAFFAGALAQLVARLTSLPAVVLLLATGLSVGRAGLDLVQPETLGRGLGPLGGLLVSLVLFDGGSKTLFTPGMMRMIGRGFVVFAPYTLYYLALAALPIVIRVIRKKDI